MTVQRVLKEKGDMSVVTVAPTAQVSEAVALLAERRIGAVVVSDDGKRPIGILSERDIVRELGRKGASVLDQPVEALMTARLVCASRDDRIDEIMRKMTEGRFRHMPVVEGEEMVGVISIGDIVKARLAELSLERDALEGMVMGH